MAAADEIKDSIAADALPQRILKDSQRSEPSDSHAPLCPEWLLTKPEYNQHGTETGEHINHLDALKASGDAGYLNGTGKKDVFRPRLHDLETGRHDRWRNEEKEANSAFHKDHRREGDRELGDARKIERWSVNSSRNIGEARRAPSERRNDFGNKEGNYDQRRESKWNTRWGPDDKESKTRHDKWSESNRVSEGSHDKGRIPQPTIHGKDTDRNANQYSHSWRLNSSISYGRGEPSHPQSLSSNKQPLLPGYGRGQGDNTVPVFPAGLGRLNSTKRILNSDASHSYLYGSASNVSNVAYENSLRYNRMKLLDIYRMTDMESCKMLSDGFTETSSLTLAKPLEPLALTSPTPDELVVLKGIDKGEIVSSSMPQVSEDGSVGRSSDRIPPRHAKPGYREGMSNGLGDYNEGSNDYTKGGNFSCSESSSYDIRSHKCMPDSKVNLDQNVHSFQENILNVEAFKSGSALKKADEVAAKELSMLEDSLPHHEIPWRSQSRDMEIEAKNVMNASCRGNDSSLYSSQGFHAASGSDPKFKRQSSEIPSLRGREVDLLRLPSGDNSSARSLQLNSSPEALSLYYRDPQGLIQGPFSGSDLIGWFEAGYFGLDLLVQLASAPHDYPFLPLGDVMPHLRTKPRPPPGFAVSKKSSIPKVCNRESFGSSVNIHGGLSDFELIKNGQKNNHGPTEAENRLLESLMSGMRVHGGNDSTTAASVGGESGTDVSYLLAQRRMLEQQRSSLDPPSFWSGRDDSSSRSNSGRILDSDSSTQHPMMLPQTSRHIPQTTDVDLLSILHATADKSPSPTVSSGVHAWSNFSDVRSHQLTPQIDFGGQQQMLHLQNQPSLSHLLNQPGDIPSLMIPPEQIFSSNMSQDPQILTILKQQHLLGQLQMHSQVPAPSELSLLDKILLLQKQHGKEQQQLLIQQQQHSISQVIPGYQSNQQQQQQRQEQHQQLLMQQEQHRLSQVIPGYQSDQHQQGQEQQKFLMQQQQYLLSQVIPGYQSNHHHQHGQGKHQQQLSIQQQQQLLSQISTGYQSSQQLMDPSYRMHAALAPGNDLADNVGLQQAHGVQQNQQIPSPGRQDGHSPNLSKTNLQDAQNVACSVGFGSLALNLSHQMFDNTAHSKDQNSAILQGENNQNSYTFLIPGMAENLSSEEVQKYTEEVFDPLKNNQGTDYCAIQPSNISASVGLDATNDLLSLQELSKASDSTSKSDQVHDMKISLQQIPEQYSLQLPVVKEVNDQESQEAKKPSEKKYRKKKNAKSQLALDIGKGLSNTIPCEQSKLDTKTDLVNTSAMEPDAKRKTNEFPLSTSLVVAGESPLLSTTDCTDSLHPCRLSSAYTKENEAETFEGKSEGREVSSTSNAQKSSCHCTWKPASGVKEKSLLEIQDAEKQRAQKETVLPNLDKMVTPANSTKTPWLDVAVQMEEKSSRSIVQNANISQFVLANSENNSSSKSKKSQFHDLLTEEVLAKSKYGETSLAGDNKGSHLPPLPSAGSQVGILTDDDDCGFIEAKDTKKSRKKATRAKNTGVRAPAPVGPTDLSTASIPVEKVKYTRQEQQEKELSPVPSGGLSLGDFVLRKGDQANSVPAPAWSNELRKVQKSTSLRDILKEQEKKMPSAKQKIPIPPPSKIQANQSSHGNISRQVSGSSPSNDASPIKPSSDTTGKVKSTIEDDLFWGSLGQSKQEKSNFSTPANSSGAISSHQKPLTGRLPELPQEVIDFRDWCETEWVRLTGTNDTSFLEFCLWQSSEEAEMFLRENLSSFGSSTHDFIDKFLNYKEFLPSDAVGMAFKAEKCCTVKGVDANVDMLHSGTAKGGGKKGKKGKKVSPSVLGFNVVSNRIMMGEIQTIED